jgi:hypothetical protein
VSSVLRTPKKEPKAEKSTGRPRIEFDKKIIEGLARIQCTDEEIAAVLGVSADTIARRKNDDPEFLEFLERGRGNGRATLRRLQWQRAQNGSDTMLVWLGKNVLGQRDRPADEDAAAVTPVRVTVELVGNAASAPVVTPGQSLLRQPAARLAKADVDWKG